MAQDIAACPEDVVDVVVTSPRVRGEGARPLCGESLVKQEAA